MPAVTVSQPVKDLSGYYLVTTKSVLKRIWFRIIKSAAHWATCSGNNVFSNVDFVELNQFQLKINVLEQTFMSI